MVFFCRSNGLLYILWTLKNTRENGFHFPSLCLLFCPAGWQIVDKFVAGNFNYLADVFSIYTNLRLGTKTPFTAAQFGQNMEPCSLMSLWPQTNEDLSLCSPQLLNTPLFRAPFISQSAASCSTARPLTACTSHLSINESVKSVL